MKRILLSAAALCAGTSLALAADLPSRVVKPAPYLAPAPVFTWTGFYVGANAGYGWGRTNDKNNPSATKQDIDGFIGGVQAGYNYQLSNNVVLGAELSASFGDISKKWEDRDNDPLSAYYGKDTVDFTGNLRAKVGYAFDRFLPYLTGGVALAHTDHTLGCNRALAPAGLSCTRGGPIGQFHTSQDSYSWGWVLGAGAEYAITNNWSARVEYLYTDIGSAKATLYDPNWPTFSDRNFKTHFSTVTFGVNYRF